METQQKRQLGITKAENSHLLNPLILFAVEVKDWVKNRQAQSVTVDFENKGFCFSRRRKGEIIPLCVNQYFFILSGGFRKPLLNRRHQRRLFIENETPPLELSEYFSNIAEEKKNKKRNNTTFVWPLFVKSWFSGRTERQGKKQKSYYCP